MPLPIIKIPNIKKKDQIRFWSKAQLTANPETCWEWGAAKDKKGYGRFSLNFKEKYMAHRMAYFLHNKKPIGNLLVCHNCDNPGCINPNHLFLGTHADNFNDMKKKGRSCKGERHRNQKYPEKRQRGETNGASVLNDGQVLAIRQEYSTGSFMIKEVAHKYGVSATATSQIIHRKTWKHI